MHPQIRHARFNLIICSVTILLTSAAYFLLLSFLDPHRARAAFGFFGLLGLLGLGPAFYHKRPDEARVILDERDKQIGEQSQVIAWRIVWLYWSLACLGPWAWVAIRSGLDAVQVPFVPVEWLPWVLMSGFLVFMTAWSISILLNYGRGNSKDDERAT
jgi:hypothetical protein